jgi:hypothetical protein
MLQQFQRVALSRAFRGGGSKGWLVAGTAVWLLRTANRVRKPEVETVYRGELKPGEQLVIDHLELDRTGRPTTRKARRATKKG